MSIEEYIEKYGLDKNQRLDLYEALSNEVQANIERYIAISDKLFGVMRDHH